MEKKENFILSDEDNDFIDYHFMLFDTGLKWDFKKGKGKSLDEMIEIAKERGLDINEYRKKNYDKI